MPDIFKRKKLNLIEYGSDKNETLSITTIKNTIHEMIDDMFQK